MSSSSLSAIFCVAIVACVFSAAGRAGEVGVVHVADTQRAEHNAACDPGTVVAERLAATAIKLEVDGALVEALVVGGGDGVALFPDFSFASAGGADDSQAQAANALYIINARTRQLIWKAIQGATGRQSDSHYEHAALEHGIVAPVVAVSDARGLATRLYVGDLGGNVWRVDLRAQRGPGDPLDGHGWFITRLASLGEDGSGADAGDNRRFVHAVDVVRAVDFFGPFDGVLIASGSSRPAAGAAATNYLFYLKDRQVYADNAAVRAENQLPYPAGRIRFGDLPLAGTCALGAPLAAQASLCQGEPSAPGWKMPLANPGEQSVSAPLVEGGRVFLSTFTPAEGGDDSGDNPGLCDPPEGEGGLYVVQLLNAESVAGNPRRFDLGAGIPPATKAEGTFLAVPAEAIEWAEPGQLASQGATQFLPRWATRLLDLYWAEHGVDVL